MTNTKHTPAPWAETSRDIVAHVGGESIYIARAFSNDEPQPGWTKPGCSSAEAEANARLIAASPTLYDYAVKQARAGDKEVQSTLDSLQLGY